MTGNSFATTTPAGVAEAEAESLNPVMTGNSFATLRGEAAEKLVVPLSQSRDDRELIRDRTNGINVRLGHVESQSRDDRELIRDMKTIVKIDDVAAKSQSRDDRELIRDRGLVSS